MTKHASELKMPQPVACPKCGAVDDGDAADKCSLPCPLPPDGPFAEAVKSLHDSSRLSEAEAILREVATRRNVLVYADDLAERARTYADKYMNAAKESDK